ncbi:MAG: bifunctional protein-serine/threonine kinase/phosphatase [Rhodocyclaceae bacterium]|nr:bifunctional protein-serine/threonine kinase/phosphatase [Rhodocyclaceae bacterium]
MPLQVEIGHSSLTGPRERNEDFCGVVTPEGAELENKGLVAALGDGLGGHKGGREASEYTVRGLLCDYYATPDTWGVHRAIDKVVTALNRWLLSQSARDPELAGMATTLSAVVLRGRRWYSAHIGDSRIYLLRAGALQRLTTDHLWDHPELKNVLSRAVGLDAHLLLDYAEGELQEGDRFVLLSDGVWGVLPETAIARILLDNPEAQAASAALTSLALAQGGQDNASAVVVEILKLPPERLRDSLAQVTRLPLPPRLKPGQELDGLVVDALLHDSRVTLLYRVHDAKSGRPLVLKTLRPEFTGDSDEIAVFVTEEWRARRVVSPFFPQIVPAEERSCLYFLMTWHEGATLQQMLDADHHFTVAEVVQHGVRLLKGIAALHRLEIVHRDIKPANVHLGHDGRLRILDLGVALSSGEGPAHDGNPGTPSFMAPELFDGVAAGVAHDLYAAGVTLYHLLTRKYPYGEIEPFQRPKFGEPVPPTRWRPEIPAWVENMLQKAVARDPGQRFETAEEFLLALERGATRPLTPPLRMPLAERNPLLLWKIVAAASLVANIVLLMLLLR